MHVILIIAQLVLHVVIEFAWSFTLVAEDGFKLWQVDKLVCRNPFLMAMLVSGFRD